MQPFALFQQDKSGTHGERGHQSEQSGEETYQAVGKDKAENGPADSSGRPIDVPPPEVPSVQEAVEAP